MPQSTFAPLPVHHPRTTHHSPQAHVPATTCTHWTLTTERRPNTPRGLNEMKQKETSEKTTTTAARWVVRQQRQQHWQSHGGVDFDICLFKTTLNPNSNNRNGSDNSIGINRGRDTASDNVENFKTQLLTANSKGRRGRFFCGNLLSAVVALYLWISIHQC